MDNALLVSPDVQPLNSQQVKHQVQVIQSIMKDVMKRDEHYGVIPGCGDKPTLLKAGAEKLMFTFRLAPDFTVLQLFPGNEEKKVGYRVECRLTSPTGQFLGSGVGECSTEEDKYKWRGSVCEDEYENAEPEDRRLKYKKSGPPLKQVKTNAQDLANTVLKMAKKRASVDAILTVCAASDIFAQDLEELTPSHNVNRQESKAQPAEPWIKGTLSNYEPKVAKGKGFTGKPHKLEFDTEEGSVWVSSFTLPDGWSEDVIETCLKTGEVLEFQFTLNGKYKNLTKLRLYSPVQKASAVNLDEPVEAKEDAYALDGN